MKVFMKLFVKWSSSRKIINELRQNSGELMASTNAIIMSIVFTIV